MEKKCNQVGVINANGYESENRVYKGGCCPAIKIGGDPKKVVKKWRKESLLSGTISQVNMMQVG